MNRYVYTQLLIWIVIVAVIFAFSPCIAETNSTAEKICRQLADSPGDTALLAKLKNEISSVTDIHEKDRFIVAYYLGCIYTDQKKEASSAKAYIEKQDPSNRYLKYLSSQYTRETCPDCEGSGFRHVQCPKCFGSGRCSMCKGSGSRRILKFGGGTRSVRCGACNGTGKCKQCGGSGKIKKRCPACLGAGGKLSITKVKATYLSLLTEKQIEEETLAAEVARNERLKEEGLTRAAREERLREEQQAQQAKEERAKEERALLNNNITEQQEVEDKETLGYQLAGSHRQKDASKYPRYSPAQIISKAKDIQKRCSVRIGERLSDQTLDALLAEAEALLPHYKKLASSQPEHTNLKVDDHEYSKGDLQFKANSFAHTLVGLKNQQIDRKFNALMKTERTEDIRVFLSYLDQELQKISRWPRDSFSGPLDRWRSRKHRLQGHLWKIEARKEREVASQAKAQKAHEKDYSIEFARLKPAQIIYKAKEIRARMDTRAGEHLPDQIIETLLAEAEALLPYYKKLAALQPEHTNLKVDDLEYSKSELETYAGFFESTVTWLKAEQVYRKTKVLIAGEVTVIRVVEGTQAEQVGLRVDDVICGYAGTKIRTAEQLIGVIDQYKNTTDQDIELVIRRRGKSHVLAVKPGRIGIKLVNRQDIQAVTTFLSYVEREIETCPLRQRTTDGRFLKQSLEVERDRLKGTIAQAKAEQDRAPRAQRLRQEREEKKRPLYELYKAGKIEKADFQKVIIEPEKYKGKVLKSRVYLGVGCYPGGLLVAANLSSAMMMEGNILLEFESEELGEKIGRIFKAVGMYGQVTITYAVTDEVTYQKFGVLFNIDAQ